MLDAAMGLPRWRLVASMKADRFDLDGNSKRIAKDNLYLTLLTTYLKQKNGGQ